MSLDRKLFITLSISIAVCVLLGAVACINMSRIKQQFYAVLEVTQKQKLADSMSSHLDKSVHKLMDLEESAFIQNAAEVERYHNESRAEVDQVSKNLAELEQLASSVEDRDFLQAMRDASSQDSTLGEEVYRKAAAGDLPGAVALRRTRLVPINQAMEARAKQLDTLENTRIAQATEQSRSIVSQSLWLAAILLIAVALVGGVELQVVRRITHTLRQTITELSQGSEQTTRAASQVSASSNSLAQGASEQAASLQQTSASSEEISSMARSNTENSRRAAELVTQSGQKIAETNQSLEQMVEAMGKIKNSSDNIARIVKTIDEVAFQTNILALNAAVEAARAGDAGMGFAVVADEVRSLAQRCAQATRDTAALIEEAIANSNDGRAKTDQVATAIRAVTDEANRVKTLVDEVNIGSQEQARGIEQIAKAILRMQQVTQRSAASAEECASAAEELNSQSGSVRAMVQRLTAVVSSGESPAAG